MALILVVDDDPMFSTPFVAFLKNMGHRCRVAKDFAQGVRHVKEEYFDVVFLDVVLPDADGLAGINIFLDAHSSPEIIIITGKSEISGARMALKNGAWDYLEKPPAYDDVRLTLKRALQYRKSKTVSGHQQTLDTDMVIGNSIKLRQCLETAAKAAKTDTNLLITGETGTGKGLLARAVHQNSTRAMAGFVTVDCTNLPDNLVESLLFGHLKGSFTGAVDHSEGLVRQADQGTLFLDEIGDLSMTAQKSILRVLQDKTFRPLGSKNELTCDFRIISATNRNLKKMVEEGNFRKDLYYRILTYHIQLPPLWERLNDIKPLTAYYIEKICDQMGIRKKTVSGDFIETLMMYEWKGNIRELISVLHSSIVNALNEQELNPHHLPVEVRIYSRTQKMKENAQKGRVPSKECIDEHMSLDMPMDENHFPNLKDFRLMNEAQYLEDLIKVSGSKAGKACAMAGISRSGLYHLLEKHHKKLKP